MKKALVFLFLTTIGLRLLANPIVLPSISISELYYSTLYEWHLELSYNASTQSGLTIDSAFISSSSDIVQLAVYSFTGNNQLFVITQDSINGVLQINRTGDTITVITYCMGMASEDV